MKKKIASWKIYSNTSYFLIVFSCIMFVIAIVDYNIQKFIDNLIIILVIAIFNLIFGTFLYLFSHIYKIEIYDNMFVKVNIFNSRKEIYYKDIILQENRYGIAVYNLDGKCIYRFSYLMEDIDHLNKEYKRFKKSIGNNEIVIYSDIVTYNFYMKNFSLFLIIFGSVIISFSLLGLFNIIPEMPYTLGITQIIIGAILFILGIIGILIYKNFMLIIKGDKIIIINFLKLKKEYDISSFFYKENINTIKLYKDKKLHKTLNKNLLDNYFKIYGFKKIAL